MTARNVELKARLSDQDQARVIASSLANRGTFAEHQIDTYFVCQSGRLKLRWRQGQASQLISYQRANERTAKPSDYQILEVADADGCRSLLESALGVLCVVEKHREVFLWDNVRIHLDDVAGLGSFLEFEACLAQHVTQESAVAQVHFLSQKFCLDEDDLVSNSYSDLIMAATAHKVQ